MRAALLHTLGWHMPRRRAGYLELDLRPRGESSLAGPRGGGKLEGQHQGRQAAAGD
jgi:hypothetical protein